MATNASITEKRTGYEQLSHSERRALQQRAARAIGGSGAVFFGRDRSGDLHFIDRIHGGVAVFETAADLDPTVIQPADCGAAATPGAWREHVRQCRGPWRDCRHDGAGR